MLEDDDVKALNFDVHGAQRMDGAVIAAVSPLRQMFGDLPVEKAGVRLLGTADLRAFLANDGAIGAIAAGLLGPKSRAVRAILFDKNAQANWSLAWHQDRTICVRQKIPAPGFGPWTVKSGLLHVAPPFDILAQMITLRIHLDDALIANAPLLIAPGSHREGRVPVESIGSVVQRCGVIACLAQAGDVWAYATPILHASNAAIQPKRRRVLHVDFAAIDLPGGLEWLGV